MLSSKYFENFVFENPFFQGVPVTELVYIHSKLMIADDKVTKILCSVEKNSEEQKPEIFLFVHFCFFFFNFFRDMETANTI